MTPAVSQFHVRLSSRFCELKKLFSFSFQQLVNWDKTIL